MSETNGYSDDFWAGVQASVDLLRAGAEVDQLQQNRRHLDTSQRAMIGDKARGYYTEKARERMSVGGKTAGRSRPEESSEENEQGMETCPDLNGTARDQAGKAVGVSGRTLDRARKVREQGTKELVNAVEKGELIIPGGGPVGLDGYHQHLRELRILLGSTGRNYSGATMAERDNGMSPSTIGATDRDNETAQRARRALEAFFSGRKQGRAGTDSAGGGPMAQSADHSTDQIGEQLCQ